MKQNGMGTPVAKLDSGSCSLERLVGLSSVSVDVKVDENGEEYFIHPRTDRKVTRKESEGQYIQFQHLNSQMDESNPSLHP